MTTKAKHTPGPWRYNPRYQVISSALDRSAPGYVPEIADVEYSGPGIDYEEVREANARLIAAAPELLEALLISLPFVEDALDSADFKPGHVKKIATLARAAIAKAEGSES